MLSAPCDRYPGTKICHSLAVLFFKKNVIIQKIKLGGVLDMGEKNLLDTLIIDALVRCVNEECHRTSTGPEVDENDGKCPHCGTLLARPKLPPNETEAAS